MNAPHDPGHGHSPAAWTAVIVSLLGLSVATVFFFIGMWTLFYVSLAVFVGGLLLGPILAWLGYGVRGPRWQPKDSH